MERLKRFDAEADELHSKGVKAMNLDGEIETTPSRQTWRNPRCVKAMNLDGEIETRLSRPNLASAPSVKAMNLDGEIETNLY